MIDNDLEFKIQSEYFAYKHEFSRLTEQEKVSYFFHQAEFMENYIS